MTVIHMYRCAEESHHSVTDILVQSTTMSGEYISHLREIFTDESEEFLSSEFFRDSSESSNIWEYYSDLSNFTSEFESTWIGGDFFHNFWRYIVTECLLYESSLSISDEVTIDDCNYEWYSECDNQEIEIIYSATCSKDITTEYDKNRS